MTALVTPFGPLEEAFALAKRRFYVAGYSRELLDDAFQESAASWSREISRRGYPAYLFDDGRLSVERLARWIIRRAEDRLYSLCRKFGRELPTLDDRGDDEGEGPTTVADRLQRTLEEIAVERDQARRELKVAVTAGGPELTYRALGFEHAEIAELLGISVGASKTRTSRARGRALEALGEGA